MQTSNIREAYMYILVGAIGAFLGGVMVLVASNALPKMMSSLMSGMMSNLMMGVGEEGCSPAET